jgi:agmatinase
MPRIPSFADADSDYNEAKFVIFGVPFDRTSSFRMGSRFAPGKIREESHNFEQYIFEHEVDLADIAIHDAGDLEEYGSASQMVEGVGFAAGEIAAKKNKFMLMVGGEHSITPPAVRAHKDRYGDIAVLALDAHLDFRSSYLNEPNSHACALKRCSEIVGTGKVASIGTRSISKEESDDMKNAGASAVPNFVSAYEVHERGIDYCLRKALGNFGKSGIYLTFDIDAIDPAYAPGTGTPEPFGLHPLQVKKLIDSVAPRLLGFDIVEVCPPYDNGNTSALAARFVREVVATVWKSRNDRKLSGRSRKNKSNKLK